ncbi:uncharacterized protein PG998_009253 [Apiospora kogelbergensis]|uniref:uncharacterized protein n=1 Tax=Apiospora kogelbergensis TaxID=1337665 RepID=UPI00312DEDFD
MAPQDVESQFRFLISCIKHSNNGRVNFEEVRKECGVISKGAAAKRFERLLKANGISHGLVGNVKDETKQETKEEEVDDPSAPGITPKRGRPTKKRKLQQVIVNADDDDEPVKGEVKSEDAIHVKSELGNHHGGYVHLPMMTAPARLYGPSPDHLGDAYVGDANDDDDIVIVGAFENASAGIGDVEPNNGKSSGPDGGEDAASDKGSFAANNGNDSADYCL